MDLRAFSVLSNAQERALSGRAIGAGVGVVGTMVTGGCVARGAVVGGAPGTAAEYLWPEHEVLGVTKRLLQLL